MRSLCFAQLPHRNLFNSINSIKTQGTHLSKHGKSFEKIPILHKLQDYSKAINLQNLITYGSDMMMHKSKSILTPEYLLTNCAVNAEKYLDRSSDVWTERSGI